MEEPSVSKIPSNRVHGSIIGSRFAFAEQRWGKSGKQILIDKLPVKERSLFESVVFENHWFDFSVLEEIDRTIIDRLSGGDQLVMHEVGRFSAEYNYSRLPQQLISQLPEDILKNAPRINVLFQDCGEVQYEAIDDAGEIKRAALIYRYPHAVPLSYCASALGYYERLLELLGYRVLQVVETECQTRGDAAHRYEISWEGARVAAAVTQSRSTGKLNIPPGAVAAATAAARSATANLNERIMEGRELAMQARAGNRKPDKWNNWRVKVLVVLITVTAAFGVVQAVFSWVTTKREAPSTDLIYKYNCSGSIKLQLRLDKPYLLVNTGESIDNVKMMCEVNGKKYNYAAKKFPGSAVIEISLGEFLSPDRKTLDAELKPAEVSINATVNNQPRACACRLER